MLIREYNAQYKHDLASCLLKNKLVIRKKNTLNRYYVAHFCMLPMMWQR